MFWCLDLVATSGLFLAAQFHLLPFLTFFPFLVHMPQHESFQFLSHLAKHTKAGLNVDSPGGSPR